MPLVALIATTLMPTIGHDYSCKGHSPGSNETHGNLTKSHVSKHFKTRNIYIYIYIPIKYCHMIASLLKGPNLGT
jgi:hypothetical protein